MPNICPLCELGFNVVDGKHTIKSKEEYIDYPCINNVTVLPNCPACGAVQLSADWVACAVCKKHKPGCNCFGCRFL